MRPDVQTVNYVLPVQATVWFRLEYGLVEEDGITYIAATGRPFDIQKNLYQPLALPPITEQPKRPEGWQRWPHLHLARLDAKSPEGVLGFVNRWGLLGLWNVEGYREWRPAGEEYKPYRVKGIKLQHDTWFSKHFISPAHEGCRYKMYREPLEAFIEAVKEFQHFVALANGEKPEGYRYAPKKPEDRKSEAQDILNRYLAGCRPVSWYVAAPEQWSTYWQAPSLLHCCYLLTWLDLTGLRQYRRCLHRPCGGFFIATRPNAAYCSTRCYENAKRLRSYHRNQGHNIKIKG
ncbi:MAG: hypothetical protein HPY90_13600 [Syntrophothermus sp.]|uniref:hypothetical protein n=1 Tax=Syntrophothermus sp. TaxID=2736299 RepID=UPI00257E1EDF|nr:hypothetical protein [Syntrophothermus sp.]NSW84280.1 hypothetical protein [Syntrophothermus sp.]